MFFQENQGFDFYNNWVFGFNLKQITETGFKKPRTLIELKEIRSH